MTAKKTNGTRWISLLLTFTAPYLSDLMGGLAEECGHGKAGRRCNPNSKVSCVWFQGREIGGIRSIFLFAGMNILRFSSAKISKVEYGAPNE